VKINYQNMPKLNKFNLKIDDLEINTSDICEITHFEAKKVNGGASSDGVPVLIDGLTIEGAASLAVEKQKFIPETTSNFVDFNSYA
jgi:hypothetical protein